MTGNIKTERESLDSRITKNIDAAVLNNWVRFNYFAIFCYLIIPPLLYPFGPFVVFVILLTFLIFPFMSERVKLSVADIEPTIFLKIEKIKRNLQKAFWFTAFFPSLVFMTILLLVPTQQMNDILLKYEPEFVISMLFFFGYYFYSALMVGNIRQQPRTLKATAKASFIVLSKSLAKSDFKKRSRLGRIILRLLGKKITYEEQWRQISLFENGLNSLNGFITYIFDIELCNTSKIKDYFRYIIWTQDNVEKERIRKVVGMLEYALRSKWNLTNILSRIKQIMSDRQSFPKEELFQELDFKTGLRRWYYHNKELLKIVLPLASLIVSVLAFLLR